jgi:hypothetical protein
MLNPFKAAFSAIKTVFWAIALLSIIYTGNDLYGKWNSNPMMIQAAKLLLFSR